MMPFLTMWSSIMMFRLSSIVCFFFSSRRRHTRCYRDWSSDVCSSDLVDLAQHEHELALVLGHPHLHVRVDQEVLVEQRGQLALRSEERRVGKECRCRWWGDD